jgi:hypothetical protein
MNLSSCFTWYTLYAVRNLLNWVCGVADIKGTWASSSRGFEISVLRDDNEHGKESYGWYGPDKYYISAGVHDRFDGCKHKFIWDGLVSLAHAFADELNRAELGKDVSRSSPKGG